MNDTERLLLERLTTLERRLAAMERRESTVGGGDMLKSVYDTNADGRVNLAADSDTVDGSHAAAFAVAAKGVTNGDSHDHAGGDGAQIDHGGLGGLADDDHTQYHTDARGDARYPLTANSVTYYVKKTGNDSNDGLSAGAPLLTIQAALNKLSGRVLKSCVIDIGAGEYQQDLVAAGFLSTITDLKLQGDARTTIGVMWVHGVDQYSNMTNCGSGSVTLSTDNSGTGGRIRITVSRATTNPNFATDGIDTTNKVVTWDGTTCTEYSVYSVSSNVITLAATTTAPSLATAGRCFSICPSVSIKNSSGSALQSFVGMWMRGIYVVSSARGLDMVGAQVCGSYCTFRATSSTSFYDPIVNSGGLFQAMEPPSNYYQPLAIFGQSHAAVATDGAMNVLSGNAAGVSITGAITFHNMSRSTTIAQYCTFPIHGGTGVYAGTGSYVNALSTSAKNYATTKYNPATTNTFGNNSSTISWS